MSAIIAGADACLILTLLAVVRLHRWYHRHHRPARQLTEIPVGARTTDRLHPALLERGEMPTECEGGVR